MVYSGDGEPFGYYKCNVSLRRRNEGENPSLKNTQDSSAIPGHWPLNPIEKGLGADMITSSE